MFFNRISKFTLILFIAVISSFVSSDFALGLQPMSNDIMSVGFSTTCLKQFISPGPDSLYHSELINFADGQMAEFRSPHNLGVADIWDPQNNVFVRIDQCIHNYIFENFNADSNSHNYLYELMSPIDNSLIGIEYGKSEFNGFILPLDTLTPITSMSLTSHITSLTTSDVLSGQWNPSDYSVVNPYWGGWCTPYYHISELYTNTNNRFIGIYLEKFDGSFNKIWEKYVYFYSPN